MKGPELSQFFRCGKEGKRKTAGAFCKCDDQSNSTKKGGGGVSSDAVPGKGGIEFGSKPIEGADPKRRFAGLDYKIKRNISREKGGKLFRLNLSPINRIREGRNHWEPSGDSIGGGGGEEWFDLYVG